MITTPETSATPASVAADLAPAPVPAPVLARAAVLGTPADMVTAAPVRAAHVLAGDVIRHPVLPHLFVTVTSDPDPLAAGAITVQGIADNGVLFPARITMVPDHSAVIAVWSV